MLCLKSIKEHKCYPCTLMKFNQLLIFILVISFKKRFEIEVGGKMGAYYSYCADAVRDGGYCSYDFCSEVVSGVSKTPGVLACDA